MLMPSKMTYPGIHIDESTSGVHRIIGVATSITAFVGYTTIGPVNKAARISSFSDFEQKFGGLNRDSEISYAVQQFFLNGGKDAYVVRVVGSDGSPPNNASDIIGFYDKRTGIYALLDVDLFNILVIPRTALLTEQISIDIIGKAASFCEERRAFYIIDPDPAKNLTDIANWASNLSTSKNAALYFPPIMAEDPLENNHVRDMPPSGMIAGIFARIDSSHGVWKAPAGIEAVMKGTQGLKESIKDKENETLNRLGINCLRTFPIYNTVIWSARTRAGADSLASEWKYIPIRRMALFLEESLYRGLKWVVFEPNEEPLWAQIRLNVGAFMHELFQKGAFQGSTPIEAYFVKCDRETTTQNDIDKGFVNIIVGFAPLKPSEFIVIKIQQLADQIQT
jgi:Bacteriophage tail sheath protein